MRNEGLDSKGVGGLGKERRPDKDQGNSRILAQAGFFCFVLFSLRRKFVGRVMFMPHKLGQTQAGSQLLISEFMGVILC